MMLVPNSTIVTIADLKAGDIVALFADSTSLQEVLEVSPAPRGGVRVVWVPIPGGRTRAFSRVMPGSNQAQRVGGPDPAVMIRCAACGKSFEVRPGETNNTAVDRHNVEAFALHDSFRASWYEAHPGAREGEEDEAL